MAAAIRAVTVTRYVAPLREGGSLPAIVEADDLGTYVLKFRGAGQGPRALVAELVSGEIARALALPVPEIAFAELDPDLGRNEPDPEIQDLIRGSGGLNLAMDFLPGAFAYDPITGPSLPDDLASAIVWFDALVTNVDRTVRNTNMLVWHRKPYLIDNGASLYMHFAWQNAAARVRAPFLPIKDHVLLRYADRLAEVDASLAARLTPEVLTDIIHLIPDEWLPDDDLFPTPDQQRTAYVSWLRERLAAPRAFVAEAVRVRAERL